MYGSSSKIGRGGARGGGAGGARNRNSFPPPPPLRNPASASRLSLGGGASAPSRRAAPGGSAPGAPAPRAVEETFSLVTGSNPLAFAMIIRLAPDLVEEIKRLEAQGGTARIKFDAFSNNTSGNVVNVGGKEFKFTWSREFGDLCDIYEERQSGEDGNGLLVESGSAWRKLNVQRILDESTTNHVKMRSVEAERKTKSRKAIVIEPGKSMKQQLAVAEANPWRMPFKQKKEPPFKKRKVDPPLVGVCGSSNSAYKPGLASAATVKGRGSSSPVPSPPEPTNIAASPVGIGNATINPMSNEDVTLAKGKRNNTTGPEKHTPARANSAAGDTQARKGNVGGEPIDLQSMLINLLKETPMSLKALEKAVGDDFPNAAKKIEPILKRIATFQAPGRYFLKSGVEADGVKKLVSESGSSLEDSNQKLPDLAINHDQALASVPDIVETISAGELDHRTQTDFKPVEQSDGLGKADIRNHLPDVSDGKKASENSEGQAGSSSGSGSDSDSDSESNSSHSGSDSESRSRSRSRSVSDSEASSNSKEGSDEDVDIMTSDDDKETKNKLQASEPIPDDKHDGNGFENVDIEGEGSENVDIEGDGSDDVGTEGHGSDAVDVESHGSGAITKCLHGDEHGIETHLGADLTVNEESEKPSGGINPFSSDHDELERQTFIGRLFDDTDNITKDSFMHGQSESCGRQSRGKSKRPHLEKLDQKSERAKRVKGESLNRPLISQSKTLPFLGDAENASPGKPSASEMVNSANRDEDTELGQYGGSRRNITGKHSPEFQESDRRLSDQNAVAKAAYPAERLNQSNEHPGDVRKPSEKGLGTHDTFRGQQENAKNVWRDGSSIKERKLPKSQDGVSAGKSLVSSDSQSKHSKGRGKFKEAGNVSNLNFGSSPIANDRVYVDRNQLNGQTSVLPRELSDLEVGELREVLPEEPPVKKQFEKSRSLKHSDNKPSVSGNHISDLDKDKNFRKSYVDSKKPSQTNASAGGKGAAEQQSEDLTRSHTRAMQPQLQFQSRLSHGEAGSVHGRLVDASNKPRQYLNGVRIGSTSEGHGENQKKAPGSEPQLNGAKQESNGLSTKEIKTRTSNAKANSVDAKKGTDVVENDGGGQTKRELFFGEDDSSYLKYEKEEPKLKGPIKDSSQYTEYVQEYRDKYDSYCSLNMILENYRNEFQKLGDELAFAKGRDVERYKRISEQLKQLYRECGTRHKRLKKVFVVLHEELKHLKQMMKDYAYAHAKDR